jgi:HrpA-like RNA helicase
MCVRVGATLVAGEDGQQAVKNCEQFLRDRLRVSQLTFEAPYLIDPAMETAPDAEIVEALARRSRKNSDLKANSRSELRHGWKQAVARRHSNRRLRTGDIAQAHTANEFVEIKQLELRRECTVTCWRIGARRLMTRSSISHAAVATAQSQRVTTTRESTLRRAHFEEQNQSLVAIVATCYGDPFCSRTNS